MTKDRITRLQRIAGFVMWSCIKSWLPLRMAYWVVFAKQMQQCAVIRQRLNPGNDATYSTMGFVTLDGPYYDQEDAARSLAFWARQYDSSLRTR